MDTQPKRMTFASEGTKTVHSLPDEEYLTVAEAAAMFRVSQSTVWRWINDGELPAFRVGHRRIRLKRADLARLITPARREGKKGGRMTQEKQLSPGHLTAREQRQMLSAVEEAKRLQAELLERRKGVPFSSSADILDELRAERTRELQ